MSDRFLLSCESTVDLPYADVCGRGISVIHYSYTVDGQSWLDDMGRDPEGQARFYRFIDAGKLPQTSQLNIFDYEQYFRTLLREGHDVLHLAFGSGMTSAVRNALLAAETLRAEFPQRRLVVLDTYCSSAGYGLLVDAAADRRDEGMTMAQLEQWVLDTRMHVNHQFFCTDLSFFRRSGRMSAASVTVASVLGICPLMRLDHTGHIVAYAKVRGKRAAIDGTVDAILARADGRADYSGKIFISNARCLADAEATRDAIAAALPRVGEIRISDIGPIIASHCGPGTVSVHFFGDERPV